MTREDRIQVVLVDDHPYVLDGLSRTLRSRGFAVTGTATNVADALDVIVARQPQVALVDVMLGRQEGLRLAEPLRESSPDTAVLFTTGLLTRELLVRIEAVRAAGMISKFVSVDELVGAIERAADGKKVVDGRIASLLDTPGAELTGREREILTRLAHGQSTEEIADELYLARHTVHTHVRNAIQRKGARNRVHAVALAAADGEIPLPTP